MILSYEINSKQKLTFVSITLNSFSQTNDSTIKYADGFKTFYRDIYKHLHPGQDYLGSPDSNRYYTFLIQITASGGLGAISINSVGIMDSIEIAYILSKLKESKGKWINNSGIDQTMVLPVYFVFNDYDDKYKQKLPNVNEAYYINWNRKKLIYLEPIIAKVYGYPDHISVRPNGK